MNQLIPIPASNVTVRPATMADLPFMDSLQKLHTKQVGWMPTKQLEGKIGAGHVLIAEEGSGVRVQGSGNTAEAASSSSLNPEPRTLNPIGYCIGHDQYFKRDDVGIIYQMNVVPGRQRELIGVTLVKALFERAAYGCRLFCCWCAQDIEANRFWESLGFVPLAFRTGSREKARVHIFWQRRIRAGDDTTPYWFPSQTSSGSIREDRLVFPIPPGTHWSDAKPIVLPSAVGEVRQAALTADNRARAPRKPAVRRPVAGPLRGFAFQPAVVPQAPVEKRKREPKAKVKHDPRHIAAARELRDRWLERVNAAGGPGGASMLESGGKYDVSRTLADSTTVELAAAIPAAVPALPAQIAA